MKLKVLVPIALIAIGAGLYGLSSQYFSKNAPAPVVSADNQPELASVYVVAQAIPKGKAITKASLEIEKVTEEQALKMGIDPSQPLSIPKGGVAIQDMTEGDFITPATLISPDEPGYINAVIDPDKVPYAVIVNPTDIVGGLITHGSLVDVVALSSEQQNLANEDTVTSYQTVSVSPVLMAVKVIKVSQETHEEGRNKSVTTITLILELTQKQVAKLAIAKNIAQLEVHKSLGLQEASELQANSGDVLPDYRAIVEFRAGEATIK
ncbi:Flp pilus assembly protein CpaB [Vibrio ichthyoenteri ATCC 700023]|uniref:Flp pilus assembly protein CpaB n=1 Tax=Vibrio ichthyoenteri ATCC 700023 TaxID=870968 RepID=F9RWY1_9VIBR|nr:Flp pilus assembly protein CpaB [Vibrio ichthyoenteri]EGU48895.1 Flp pilus assembly protein CpaB [Vibrio ichthyoenteri ATCC 700023]